MQSVYPEVDPQVVSPGGQCFVQDTQPTGVTGSYMWIQTGLGDDGLDWTIWIEDGTAD